MSGSFFGVFSYNHIMYDTMDYGILYQDIVITKDILTLNKGDIFDQVNFNIFYQYFYFTGGCASKIITPIPQSMLAPFLELGKAAFPASKTLASVDNHVCVSCGNNKLSKTEKSCWKCGTKI